VTGPEGSTAATPGDSAIRHDTGDQRFSTVVDGEKGFVAYERDGAVLTITHTVVPPAIGGRGIAGRLVRAVLDFARGDGLKVRPRCSYADDWMRRHPDYDTLRA
jgi:predicted GNAT family acetyltransferase